jgi:hypothetical protein
MLQGRAGVQSSHTIGDLTACTTTSDKRHYRKEPRLNSNKRPCPKQYKALCSCSWGISN